MTKLDLSRSAPASDVDIAQIASEMRATLEPIRENIERLVRRGGRSLDSLGLDSRNVVLACQRFDEYVASLPDEECQVPPIGWSCSRPAGHEGPCAASPTKTLENNDGNKKAQAQPRAGNPGVDQPTSPSVDCDSLTDRGSKESVPARVTEVDHDENCSVCGVHQIHHPRKPCVATGIDDEPRAPRPDAAVVLREDFKPDEAVAQEAFKRTMDLLKRLKDPFCETCGEPNHKCACPSCDDCQDRTAKVCRECASKGEVRLDPESVARRFHEAYERLAPSFGYKTREASAVPWDKVPDANRALMVATVKEVLTGIGGPDEWGMVDIEALEKTHEALPNGELSKTILSLCGSLRMRRNESRMWQREVGEVRDRLGNPGLDKMLHGMLSMALAGEQSIGEVGGHEVVMRRLDHPAEMSEDDRAMLIKLHWMRDTVGVDIENMFARALKAKDGRQRNGLPWPPQFAPKDVHGAIERAVDGMITGWATNKVHSVDGLLASHSDEMTSLLSRLFRVYLDKATASYKGDLGGPESNHIDSISWAAAEKVAKLPDEERVDSTFVALCYAHASGVDHTYKWAESYKKAQSETISDLAQLFTTFREMAEKTCEEDNIQGSDAWDMAAANVQSVIEKHCRHERVEHAPGLGPICQACGKEV